MIHPSDPRKNRFFRALLKKFHSVDFEYGFHPFALDQSRGRGVSKVFFVERTEGEVLYALTLPVDTLLLERE